MSHSQDSASADVVTPQFAEWADHDLPITKGLRLWIDIERQGKAWSANQRSALTNGSIVDRLYDASGYRNDAYQDNERSFPKWKQLFGKRVIEFDGEDDYLRSDLSLASSAEATFIAVVSAKGNRGLFRSIASASAHGRNDYVAGFNIDLGPAASTRWDFLNIEGSGFSGANNYINSPTSFGKFQIVTVRISKNEVTLWPGNDEKQRTMARRNEPLSLSSLWLGARYYSNTGTPPTVSGFWQGDIAEVMFFERALSDSDVKQLEAYLNRKHASLFSGIADSARQHPLVTLEQPPVVQVLVPGFNVTKLPVDITNINNLRYRHDGKLIALGYNGNIYVLDDSNGDGLEDRSRLYWENKGRLRGPIGMVVTTPQYSRGVGVLVASKGKVSFIRDTDGDDIADNEEIVASGWQEITQNVDALGVALAPDESIYFSLGTTNYANGYLLDNQGKSQFDLKSERGTVLKVSPDWSKREVICTGVRFPVALDFNDRGDLFATDQEGATWLSNGNPFDELLHIETGKHYGFPPSHPKHLPGVIDEPSVFDFGPQHQSTCGMFFNRSVLAGPRFGPTHWHDSLFVCGESRGKLYRTELYKTANGYLARNRIIACLSMLTVDCTVTPRGTLLVACHSGPPDWGTGPEGKGAIFEISYVDPTAPIPVAAWPSSKNEIVAAFDRSFKLDDIRARVQRSHLEMGPFNSAGDRFEVLAPPYAIVQMQRESIRNDLPNHGLGLESDNGTLRWRTEGLTADQTVSITMFGADEKKLNQSSPVTQLPDIDFLCEPNGLLAQWKGEGGACEVAIPHVDLQASKYFTRASLHHKEFWEAIHQRGLLTLSGAIDISNLLQPRLQPGTQLDYQPSVEQGSLHFHISSLNEQAKVWINDQSIALQAGRAQVDLDPYAGKLLHFRIELATSAELSPQIEIGFTTKASDAVRPLALRRFLLPYLPQSDAGSPKLGELNLSQVERFQEPSRGAWLRGQSLFFGKAQCSKCHSIRNFLGSEIGPDLSNLVHRDEAGILRDIRQPNATLNPDHLMLIVRTSDGEVVQGVPLANTEKDFIVLGLSDGTRRRIAREDIEEQKASAESLMPKELIDSFTPSEVQDLLCFLRHVPLEPASVSRTDQPPYRKWNEIDQSMTRSKLFETVKLGKVIKVVLCDGPKDHGVDEHDYPEWKKRWSRLLSLSDEVQVEEASEWPSESQFATADVIVFYSANPRWQENKGAELDRYLQRGGGLLFMHFAVNGQGAVNSLAARIGLACDTKILKYRHGALNLQMESRHPLSANLPDLGLVDESYWRMTGDANQIQVVASGEEEGTLQPLVWTVERGKGRVFVSIMGHYSWTLDDPLYRRLFLRGMAWSAQLPPDSLLPLSAVGARISK